MTEQRPQGPGERARRIPRDMPDQQASTVEDPWDIRAGRHGRAHPPDTAESAKDAPDTDEDRAPTDHPVPEEPSD
ncbi:hypothetical protein [Streptomyces sp. NPDC001222]|uniref:hypothetical protein n=1 Tax=Streptomyces sp. NPDC001222 TaxID=3364548 RepID=UPI0036C3CAA4